MSKVLGAAIESRELPLSHLPPDLLWEGRRGSDIPWRQARHPTWRACCSQSHRTAPGRKPWAGPLQEETLCKIHLQLPSRKNGVIKKQEAGPAGPCSWSGTQKKAGRLLRVQDQPGLLSDTFLKKKKEGKVIKTTMPTIFQEMGERNWDKHLQGLNNTSESITLFFPSVTGDPSYMITQLEIPHIWPYNWRSLIYDRTTGDPSHMTTHNWRSLTYDCTTNWRSLIYDGTCFSNHIVKFGTLLTLATICTGFFWSACNTSRD